MAGIKAKKKKEKQINSGAIKVAKENIESHKNVVSNLILTLIYFPTTCDVYLGRAGIYRKRKYSCNYTKENGNKC